MTDQEEQEHYRYIQIKMKMGAAQPVAQAAAPPQSMAKNVMNSMMDSGKQLFKYASPVGPMIAAVQPKETYKETGSYWPAAGAVAGNALLPGAGSAIGAGAGQIARNMAGIAYGDPDAPTSALGAGLAAAGQTALAGFPETEGAQNFLEKTALNQGRRALGFTKRFLNKPRAIVRANQVAKTMLDQGVIRPFSGAEATLGRAEQVGEKAGRGIGKLISKIDAAPGKVFDSKAVINDIETQLKPKFKGGYFDDQSKTVKKLVDTVKAIGGDAGKLGDAQKVKQILQELGNFESGASGTEKTIIRRASGIVRKSIEDSIEKTAGLKALPGYLKNKKIYGASELAQKGLTNRLSSEMGNKQLGLTDLIAGGAELASGGLGKAAALVGAKKVLERLGAPTVATGAHALANMGMRGPVASGGGVLISELLKRLRAAYQSASQ